MFHSSQMGNFNDPWGNSFRFFFELSFLLHGLPAVGHIAIGELFVVTTSPWFPQIFQFQQKKRQLLGEFVTEVTKNESTSCKSMTIHPTIDICVSYLVMYCFLMFLLIDKKPSKQMTNVCLCPQVCFWRSMRILILKDSHCWPSFNGSKLGDYFHDFSSSFVTSALLVKTARRPCW